jgi:glycosyltransferase involved in cell wall biosynthesis
MRILYVSSAYKGASRMGGPPNSISAAAEALVRAGHTVTVATTNANLDQDLDVPLNQPVDINGVTVWYFRREEPLRKWLPFVPYLSQSSGFAYAPEMKRALSRLVADADVVDTQTPFVYPTYAASKIAQRLGKPLFYHQRGNLIPSRLRRRQLKKTLYIALLERRIMTRAAGLIALTDAESDAFHSIVPETPCDVVPNGVDVPPPDPSAAVRVAARWGIPSDAPVMLYLGRLEPWKGCEELMQTFARIQNAHPDAFLVMAGVDQFEVRQRWQRLAAHDGYAHRLLFTGSLSGQEKADILHRADLFCLPSHGEGLSMSMLEAMAHGTAVVLSPECCFPVAERAGAGVIVPRDIAAMAAAMDELLRDPERLRTMGENGRELMLRCYSWEAVARRHAEVYARAVP